jgi:hypothetical protein
MNVTGQMADPSDRRRWENGNGFATNADGTAITTHTYDGMWTDKNGIVWRFGGAPDNQSGGFYAEYYSLDPVSGIWTHYGPAGGSKFRGISLSAYHHRSNKALIATQGESVVRFIRCDDGTVSNDISISAQVTSSLVDPVFALNDTTGDVLVFGNGSRKRIEVDWDAETVILDSFAPSGTTSILDRSAVGAWYDADVDVFWIFGGNIDTSTSIYRMDASTFAITEHALSQQISHFDNAGTYNRGLFLQFGVWRGLAIVTNYLEAPYVIKLPEAR